MILTQIIPSTGLKSGLRTHASKTKKALENGMSQKTRKMAKRPKNNNDYYTMIQFSSLLLSYVW